MRKFVVVFDALYDLSTLRFIISVLHISFDCITVPGLFGDNCVIYILDIYNDIVDHCIYTLLI